MNKRIGGLVLAFALFLVVYLAPCPDGLIFEGKAALAILFACIVLWVTEALPVPVTGILIVVCIPAFSVIPLGNVWSSFANSALLFVIASFGICAGMLKTNFPLRITGAVLKWAKGDSKKVVYGYVFGATLLSTVLTDTAACSVFVGLAMSLIVSHGDPKPGASNLAKCLMMGVALGALAGGLATPAGNAVNILALSLMESTAGIEIGFFHWMVVGVPLAAVVGVVSALWLVKLFPPEEIEPGAYESIIAQADELGGLDANEKKFSVILAVMMALWIASTWVPALNVTLVALTGVAVMFLPGVDLLEGREYMKSVQAESIIMIGSVSVLVAGLSASGAAAWVMRLALSGAADWPLWLVWVVVSVLMCLLHVMVPNGPAVAGLAVVPVVAIGQMYGLNLYVIGYLVALWASIEYLLPVDGIYLLSYPYGHYSVKDTLKLGWLPTLVLLALSSTIVPFVGGIIWPM